MKNICKTCSCWVDCKDKGFCLCEDLFTYTEKSSCKMYEEGTPITEEEYEKAQEGCLD
ncbi:MAG: hypothetical protein J6S85_19765 [Methanobrevibacter sp.]|nr:hypothetical protein [Methanobrevibacter sp.]